MSGSTSPGAGRVALVAALVVGALLVVGVISVDRRTGEPNDPASAEKDGTMALVELAERFGATVEVAHSFPVDADVAIAFEDTVSSANYEDVNRWMAAGHTLILADASSSLTPAADATGTYDETLPQGDCDIEALSGARSINVGEHPSNLRFEPKPELQVCFADDGGAFVAVTEVGAGQLVSLIDGTPLQNRQLDEADNAVLATALLAPRPGTRVAFLADDALPGPKGPVSVSIQPLLDEYPRVGFVILQIGVALAVLALVRARRLGRPVAEPQPVQIAGSSLVEATGHLLRQRKDPEEAAKVLRSAARRTVAERSALPVTAPTSVLAETLSARTGRSVEESLAVLDGPPLTSDHELVELAAQIDNVVEEVSHGRTP